MSVSTKSQRLNSSTVIDVNENTFEQDVLARSREVPVVIDFWAPWCGPCRTLGPMLERLANEAAGDFVLAKVNVDENQRLAAAFRVQGIPAVKAVRDGRVVDEFTGAIPESQIRAWLKRIAPTQSDGLVETAAKLEATNPDEAAARYRLVLGSDPTNTDALFALGRLLLFQGDQEGLAVLNEIPSSTPLFARAQDMLKSADFFTADTNTNTAQLTKQVQQNGNDLEARYQLARQATRSGRYADALDQLLTIVQRNRAFREDAARKTMLSLFAALGDENPLVGEYRRKLANILF